MGKPKKAVVKIDVKTDKVMAIYDSVGSASKASYVCENSIRDFLYGRTKNPSVYKWAFLEKYKKDYNVSDFEIIKSYNKNDAIPVIQYDLQGNFIAEYPSLNQACKASLYCSASILKCCKGESKSFGGFIWRYKNNDR
ncbi:NUMOD1 domain-containing DNA-binding protein [Clostridium tyrobutyricum]|jgi:hypothetical protein|uniref:NUMOD1 domain-containing DNA-binding protein n=1 Tax=Clostridium tyrobutyricum TaxID=1519 RepID=UPI001C38A2A4|nr:NUMOD1 domain-containing DNA-binding protein [Clostridium tyrobutyricum]MBV4429077.1 hypothetical protein [Clostridium tyrobutyricum]MBV4444154.1 hypothetical protein [Clostridium tyrobutyricum]